MLKGCKPATLALRSSVIHGTVVSRTHDYYSLAASRGGKQPSRWESIAGRGWIGRLMNHASCTMYYWQISHCFYRSVYTGCRVASVCVCISIGPSLRSSCHCLLVESITCQAAFDKQYDVRKADTRDWPMAHSGYLRRGLLVSVI